MKPVPALILAAGRGERMRPLTDATPKPLLPVRGKPLIEWHLEALARDGVREVVINTAWLEERFPAALGDGSRWGLAVRYSMEGRDFGAPLETAGGIVHALPLLQSDTFWVVAGDIHMPGLSFAAATVSDLTDRGDLGHLVMVPNPPHHPEGDFALSPEGRVMPGQHLVFMGRYTYAGVGLFNAEPVEGLPDGARAPLRPFLERAITAGRLSGSLYRGPWSDVGSPQRWEALQTGA